MKIMKDFFLHTIIYGLTITIILLPKYLHCNTEQLILKSCFTSSKLNEIPQFKIYFKGTQTTSNQDGFFSIPFMQETQQDAYFLLICKDFQQNFDAINTIRDLTINPKKPYKFFALKKATIDRLQNKIFKLQKKATPVRMHLKLLNKQVLKQKKFVKALQQENLALKNAYNINKYKNNLKSITNKKNKTFKQLKKLKNEITFFAQKLKELKSVPEKNRTGDYWLISEKNLQKYNFIIPQNCVIACLNPKTVDHIENWKFPLEKNFIAFPKIVLEKNLEKRNIKRKQSITRSSVKSEFNSLETKAFHEPIKEEYRYFSNKPGVKASLVR